MATSPKKQKRTPRSWSNWSGKQKSDGLVQVIAPSNEQDFVDIVSDAETTGQKIRAVGASHSHSQVAVPEAILVTTDNWQGLIGEPRRLTDANVSGTGDREATTATVKMRSGTRIFQVGEPLWQFGLGLCSQGDIDRQSIAGAISTGTHGSGRDLQSLSASVVGLRVVLADGQLVDCSGTVEPDLFAVARHSLGSVGLVSEVELAVRDRYRLEEKLWSDDPETVMAKIGELVAATRHFEFFWMPQSDRCACKSLDEVGDEADSERAFDIGPIEQHSKLHRTGWSHQIISTLREDLHTEMEFAVPREHGPACFAEIRAMILRRFPDLRWPVEYRTVASDDLAISTTSGRPTVTISVHQDIAIDDLALFEACEEIFRRYHGRPHWGKVHYHNGSELALLYDQYSQWWETRDRYDPQGRFLNAHLESLRP